MLKCQLRVDWYVKILTNCMEHNPSWKPLTELVKKFPAPVPLLGQINLVHTLEFYFLKMHFNIFPFTLKSSNFSLSFRFPLYKHPVCAFPVPHTCHVPIQSHYSSLYRQNDIQTSQNRAQTYKNNQENAICLLQKILLKLHLFI